MLVSSDGEVARFVSNRGARNGYAVRVADCVVTRSVTCGRRVVYEFVFAFGKNHLPGLWDLVYASRARDQLTES